MNEHVWERRGVGRPLDRLVGTSPVRIPPRSLILATASILVVTFLRPTAMSSPVVLGSPSTADTPTTHMAGPALTFHVPVNLRLETCARCFIGPFLIRSYIPYPARFGTGNCEQPWLIGFASTAATSAVVRSRLDSSLAGSAIPDRDPLSTSALSIGGTSFTVLDYGFGGCIHAIAIGEVDAVTYLIDLRMSTSDPTIDLIIRSIAFTN